MKNISHGGCSQERALISWKLNKHEIDFFVYFPIPPPPERKIPQTDLRIFLCFDKKPFLLSA